MPSCNTCTFRGAYLKVYRDATTLRDEKDYECLECAGQQRSLLTGKLEATFVRCSVKNPQGHCSSWRSFSGRDGM